MSIPYSGSLTKSGGISAALAKQTRIMSLKPVKRIVFQFDPFVKESEYTRDFLYNISKKSVIKTNPACLLKKTVVCDRSDPLVTFHLENGQNVQFKAKNLSTLEMLQLYNKHITSLVPKEDTTAAVTTKAEKAAKKR